MRFVEELDPQPKSRVQVLTFGLSELASSDIGEPGSPGYNARKKIQEYAQHILDAGERVHEGSAILSHARGELEIAGNDADYNNAIIAAIEGFLGYGHSGGSSEPGIYILNDLLLGKNLTPLTDDPKEWMDVYDGGEDKTLDPPVWQSTRRSDAFSNDGGKTHYVLEEDTEGQDGAAVHTMHDSLHKEVSNAPSDEAGT